MVAGKSPEWLPSGFVEKVRYKNGKKIKHYHNVATGEKYFSKKDVLLSVKSDNDLVATPPTKTSDNKGVSSKNKIEAKNGDDKGLSSNNKVEATSAKTNGSSNCLPNGWIVEDKKRKSGARSGDVYKVYTELTSGNKFYSWAAVTRYLNTLDHADTPSVQNNLENVDEPSPDISLQHKSRKNTKSTPVKRRKGNSSKKLDNVAEPSPDMSVQHKSTESTEGAEKKRRKGNSSKTLDNVAEPSTDMSVQHQSLKNTESIPEKKKRRGNSSKTLDNVDEPSPNIVLEHKPMTNTESTPEMKKKANLFEMLDNVAEPSTDMSVQHQSLKNTESILEKKKRRRNSSKTLDNVDEPSPNIVLEHKPMTNTESIPEKKKKANLFETISTVTTAAEDLPPGWIKEIKTSKSGNKIRKDPFYTDPVSGYVFRSKLDAIRFLETNDISSCACKPRKRELDDLNLIKNEIPSPAPPPSGKLYEEQKLLLFGPDSDGEDIPEKTPEESEPKISKQPEDKNEHNSYENSKRNAETGNNPDQEIDSYENSSKKNAENENNLNQENELSNKIQETPPSDSKKSRKRKKSNVLPSRASKRLVKSQSEMQSNSVLNEHALRSAAKGTSEIEVDFAAKKTSEVEDFDFAANRTSEIEEVVLEAKRTSEIEEDDLAAKGTSESEDINLSAKQIPESDDDDDLDIPPGFSYERTTEKRISDSEELDLPPGFSLPTHTEPPKEPVENKKEIEPPRNVENQNLAIPGDDGKRPQEPSQLCYDFGDSWSDPLEFALKTLRGEISIDDNLAFPGCFDDIPYNNHNNNQVEPNPEPSKQNGGVDLLPNSSSLFDINFPSCSDFNSQSSAEAGKNDCQKKFNP